MEKISISRRFNTLHPPTNFTLDEELNDSISFLVVSLTNRLNETLKRTVSRKPITHSIPILIILYHSSTKERVQHNILGDPIKKDLISINKLIHQNTLGNV